MFKHAENMNHVHLFSASLNDRYELCALKRISWDVNYTEHFRIWRWDDSHVSWPHTVSLSRAGKAQNTFFVRPCYVVLYDAVWNELNSGDGPSVVVVTGTPGTGKVLYFACYDLNTDDFACLMNTFTETDALAHSLLLCLNFRLRFRCIFFTDFCLYSNLTTL